MKEFVAKDDKKLTKKRVEKEEKVEQSEEKGEKVKKPKLSKKQRIEEKRKFKIGKLRESKTEVEQNLTAAQSSTKSLGLFDRKAHKEEREHKVKRRKQYANFSNIEDQMKRNLELFDIVKQSGLKKLQHSL